MLSFEAETVSKYSYFFNLKAKAPALEAQLAQCFLGHSNEKSFRQKLAFAVVFVAYSQKTLSTSINFPFFFLILLKIGQSA